MLPFAHLHRTDPRETAGDVNGDPGTREQFNLLVRVTGVQDRQEGQPADNQRDRQMEGQIEKETDSQI